MFIKYLLFLIGGCPPLRSSRADGVEVVVSALDLVGVEVVR